MGWKKPRRHEKKSCSPAAFRGTVAQLCELSPWGFGTEPHVSRSEESCSSQSCSEKGQRENHSDAFLSAAHPEFSEGDSRGFCHLHPPLHCCHFIDNFSLQSQHFLLMFCATFSGVMSLQLNHLRVIPLFS